LKFNFLLLTRINEEQFSRHIKSKEFHVLIGERLRCGDHFTVVEEELHNVSGGAIQLWSELLSRHPALDDDRSFRNWGGTIGELEMLRLQLVLVATTTSL